MLLVVLLTAEDFTTGRPYASYEVETATLGSEVSLVAELVAVLLSSEEIVDDFKIGRPYASCEVETTTLGFEELVEVCDVAFSPSFVDVTKILFP